MVDSPGSSDLSDPPSVESDPEDQLSTAVPSSRPSVDIAHVDPDHLAPPSKRRKTGQSSLATLDRAPSSQAAEEDDNISISSDDFSSAPGSPTHDEYSLRDEAQTQCLWRDCPFGEATTNDELVKHVQSTHCATGGPKKTKYVCEWGECQRKTSNHPSGYALKAHMRSHTKEKPYYCALPECDKAFTRSDALAKHMRTVHEPEPARPSGSTNEPTPPGKKSIKLKLTNGSSSSNSKTTLPATSLDISQQAPTHDEDGRPVDPSPSNENITYVPACHPVTGQPGFMITYPPDIHFTAWESSIAADQLMRLLRRQLHWAQREGEELKRENAELERVRREEWGRKEMLLDGALEADLERAGQEGWLRGVDARVREAMREDVEVARSMTWTGGTPFWRRNGGGGVSRDEEMTDVRTPERPEDGGELSPPPTGQSAEYDEDGDDLDPYDYVFFDKLREYEKRQWEKSMGKENVEGLSRLREGMEVDAVGALMGMKEEKTSA